MSDVALVLVGHGSHLDPQSARPLYDHADEIRSRDVFDAVYEAFWKESPSPRDVLRTVEQDDVYVVPLFTSEGYFTDEVIPRELRIADGWDLDVDKSVQYTDPVGTHEAMTDVIARRAERVTGNPDVGSGVGLAVVGHGTERNENSARATRTHAEQLRNRERFDEVRALFMDQDPRIEDLTDHFESDELVVVPLFIADGYHTQEDIPEDIGLTDDANAGYDVPAEVDAKTVWYAGAVGTEPLVADVVLERVMDSDGERVKSDPATGTASQPNRSAVVHCTRIDELVRSASDGIDFDGLSVEHDERFTFETRSTRHKGLTESAFRTAARDHPRYVSNWYHWEHEVGGHGTHRREFLRWLEGARRPVSERYDALQTETGFSRTWGELALSVRLTEGFEREYTVRHIEDRDEDASALHTPDDPSAIRDLSRSTDDGTYRPLRTAPTLPTGWSFETNDPDDLYRVVEWVYPATVANWNEERSGNLDVTHFEETADRQTGIYAEIGALDGDALENAVVACCADSVCCKRREWDATDAEDIAVPRGDGEFPCREPCSLFVAAAREFLAVEREDADDGSRRGDADDGSRFERATERGTDGKQAFVDAIVVDSSVRDGELSDSGNRYRVRYRHAKQFEEVR